MYTTHDLRNRNKSTLKTVYWSIFGVVCAFTASLTAVFAAEDIFSRAATMLSSINTKILGLTTLIAVIMATIALIIRMGKNTKAIEQANDWLKRIIISWIAINSMTHIIVLLQQLVGTGGQYTG